MSTLFISYDVDEIGIASEVERRLVARGHRVGIPVGSSVAGNWRAKFTKALVSADVMIVVLGERALDSKNVLGEIGAARAFEQTRGMLLLPVLVGEMPVPEFVRDVYCHRLQTFDGLEYGRLADALDRAIAENGRTVPRVFVSHRHRDRSIAARLVALLEAGFVVTPRDIRCTSVSPYMLTPGERTSERLRTDIAGAELVIGVLSPDASESNYVLCELGAAWGRDVPTFPVLVRGATIADVPPPLDERHSLSLEQPEACVQLVDYVASRTSLSRRDLSSDLSAPASELAREASVKLAADTDWEHVHDPTYTGPVWIKLQTFDSPRSAVHQVFIRWGRSLYSCEVSLAASSAIYLTHDKHEASLVPIRVHATPACGVSFGVGSPPEPPVYDIRRGWHALEHPAGGG